MPQIRIHNPKQTDMCTKSRRITTGFFLFYKVCQILIKDVITRMCCWYKQIDFTNNYVKQFNVLRDHGNLDS